jgi:hypothetical protein
MDAHILLGMEWEYNPFPLTLFLQPNASGLGTAFPSSNLVECSISLCEKHIPMTLTISAASTVSWYLFQ